jgi:hypothetical protein
LAFLLDLSCCLIERSDALVSRSEQGLAFAAAIALAPVLAASVVAVGVPPGLAVSAEGDCPAAAEVAASLGPLLVVPLRTATASVRRDESPRGGPSASTMGRTVSAASPSVGLEAAALLGSATDDGATMVVGGTVRATVGGRLGLTCGVSMMAPESRDLLFGKVNLFRAPTDVGLRLMVWDLGPMDAGIEGGLAATFLEIDGLGFPTTHRVFRMELGLRSRLIVRLRLEDRWALVAGAEGIFSPAPIKIALDPIGEVGSSGSVWLSGSLGAEARFE